MMSIIHYIKENIKEMLCESGELELTFADAFDKISHKLEELKLRKINLLPNSG